MTAVQGLRFGQAGVSGQILCVREYMNSLADSSFQEVKISIQQHPVLSQYYECGRNYIRSKDDRIHYVFAGLRHNLDSIKSKARILLAWADEAEPVSDIAWTKLIPTVREDNSEIWVTWNPEVEGSATDKRFRQEVDDDMKIVEMNWRDNPRFPSVLHDERLRDKRNRPDYYDHIWEGGYLTVSDRVVFNNKFRVEQFEVTDDFGMPLQGMDFGFSVDPLAVIRCYIKGNTLFISHEAYKTGIEMDKTVEFIESQIPGFTRTNTKADSAEPKSISYLSRHGMNISSVKKWPNSVVEGVRYLLAFDEIIIHPRCTNTASEFRRHSYMIDKNGEVTTKLEDANNHAIDAIRYALSDRIKQNQGGKVRFRI